MALNIRRAHLVGSLPAGDAAEAMRFALDHLGPHLDHLPDGETGERRQWIMNVLDGFRRHPALETARDGDFSGYDTVPRYRVRRGERLYGATLDLGIAAAAEVALPIYRAAREAAGKPFPTFQVGIPGSLDLALFAFGPGGVLRYEKPFAEALSAAMHQVAGADVLFQMEIPAELVLTARTPKPARKAIAGWLASRVTALALGAPAGARFGVHLCLGDLHHRALGRMADAEPLVRLANALTQRWPGTRPLQYVHVPLAAGAEPPVVDPAFYRPLSELRLRGARLVAGYAHERQDLQAQLRIRGHVEEAVGAPADVSTSCGLGRRDRAGAAAAMERIKTLVED
ncbi:hypothetical protein [Paractinoplanes lichenicola]|uniref:Methionine synthase n=1 Tax=Paractinoplanes lichenicola TaxID=2802976 RepID=A0ABS1VZK6_9ACTN|nr:hypothetical protein [Actinoplanes lichenicola]MBL7259921.1 hypothetical protein [Actinoplanes lichenicola]